MSKNKLEIEYQPGTTAVVIFPTDGRPPIILREGDNVLVKGHRDGEAEQSAFGKIAEVRVTLSDPKSPPPTGTVVAATQSCKGSYTSFDSGHTWGKHNHGSGVPLEGMLNTEVIA